MKPDTRSYWYEVEVDGCLVRWETISANDSVGPTAPRSFAWEGACFCARDFRRRGHKATVIKVFVDGEREEVPDEEGQG